MSPVDKINCNIMDELAINNFREYLRIPSVHPNINYDAYVNFLQNQAKTLNLPCVVHYCKPKNPIVVISWIGKESNIPSLLLNSHMDVVPVFEDKWTHAPFDAHMDEQGNIYARGAQDMKSVGIQYLESIRRLKADGATLRRSVHVLFVPDEEVGGYLGMKEFVKTPEFRNLNVGFALDEAYTSPDEIFKVCYGERTVWMFEIHCPGQSGHGSLLLDNTPGEKLSYVLNKLSNFRAKQKKKLMDNPNLAAGDVTSVNVTMLKGGVQSNVIPQEFSMVVDCRISVSVDLKEWEETLNRWCKEAGEGVWIEYITKEPYVPVTNLDSNNYWSAFKETFHDLGLQMNLEIFPGGTDCRYLRSLGIPVIGFSPINNTAVRLHDHNEYLNANVFLQGIEIYSKLITSIANVANF